MSIYKTKRWRNKRVQILRRDKHLCQICLRYGKKTDAVTVHHVKHVEDYPELAFVDENLISLCNDCHNKEHPEKGKKSNQKRRYS